MVVMKGLVKKRNKITAFNTMLPVGNFKSIWIVHGEKKFLLYIILN